jgi:predicted transcriptional regulator
MQTVNGWLHTQTAGEIMSRDLSSLHPDDRLSDALDMFIREQISGAPVVDDHGVCLGMLSLSDILTAHAHDTRAGTTGNVCDQNSELADPGSHRWQRLAELCRSRRAEEVSCFMTRDVVSVSETTHLADCIKKMIDAHLHRLLVKDEQGRPRGIVSTTDLLAAALRAGE